MSYIVPKVNYFTILSLLAFGLFFSCDKDDLFSDNLSIDPNKGLAIINYSGDYGCTIVYGNDPTNAMGLIDACKSLFGTVLPSYSFEKNFNRQEILVGNIERKESQQSLSKLSGEGFIINVSNRKLVIAGTDDSWTALALYEFYEKVLCGSNYFIGNTLVIPLDFSMKYDTSDPQMIAYLLDRGYDFSLSPSHILTCPTEGSISSGQGTAGGGGFFYFALKNNNDTSAKIIKYDITSLRSIGKTEVFNGGHANDLTFNSDDDCLYLAHGQSQGKIVTVVSSKTMSVIGDIQIPVGAGAITYSTKRKQFAVSQGGKTLHFLDSSFKLINSYDRTDLPGYTAQGMGSDDSYIYFPMSGSKDNIVVVYDWSGNYITTLLLDLPYESESFFYASGNYYVSFVSSASSLYILKPVIRFHV